VTGPIDRAFVEIEPDTRDFSRELQRDTDAAYAKLQKSTLKTVKVIERAFDDAGDEIEHTFESSAAVFEGTGKVLVRIADDTADDVADHFERAGERIEDAFREASRVAAIQEAEISHQAKQAADELDRTNGTLRRSFSRVTETVVALGSALIGLGASAPTPAGIIAILTVVGLIASLTGPLIAVVGALADLVGLIGVLPAGVAVLVAAFAPLLIAFQGFGDAVSAIISKDPEKIAEAMQKLSPAARSVAREFASLVPLFERFQKSVQQSFFRVVAGDLTRLGTAILPVLQKGMDGVATAIGRALSNFSDFLRESGTLKIINNVFATTARVIDAIAPGLQRVVEALFKIIDAGLPFIERFAKGFGDLLTKFADFLEQSTKTGAFNDFVEDAIRTFNELVDLVKALGGLFVALFSDADDEGRDFIQTITDMINDLAEFFRSAEGKKALDDLVSTVKEVGLALIALGKVIQFAFRVLDGFFDLGVAVIKFFKDFGSAVGDIGSAVGSFFSDLFDDVAGFFSDVSDFFSALPGKIIDFLKSLPGRIADFFQSVFDAALRAIGVGIGLLLFAFLELPKRIFAAIVALPGQIATFFTNLWQGARDITARQTTSLLDFIKQLPGRIVSFLKSIGPLVANIFRDAVDAAKRFVVSGFNNIVNFVRSVPGRIRDAFKAAGSFVSDIGGAIAGSIKSFLNRAIDKINEGISAVDDFLPGSLPRIPRLARGAVIDPTPGGILANIGEGGQREIVTPEDLLRDIVRENQGIVFGPGSIVIEFSGTVPTEAEAMRTGQAVASGISSMLQQRDVRTRVRAL
jgi:phage-related protein